MARTLAGYLQDGPHSVFHARDLGLHNKPDIEWIKYLSESGDDWLVFTGDAKIRKNRAEREAYRRAGLKGVVLSPAYQKTDMARCCGMIVANWDDLVSFFARIAPPLLVELSINLSKRYRVLPL